MMNKRQRRKARETEIIELNKRGLCPHKQPIENSKCPECHRVYVEMALDAMGDDRPDLEY